MKAAADLLREIALAEALAVLYELGKSAGDELAIGGGELGKYIQSPRQVLDRLIGCDLVRLSPEDHPVYSLTPRGREMWAATKGLYQ